ncbi:hypothetical protein Tco_1499097 [Tanacetum coccineum]
MSPGKRSSWFEDENLRMDHLFGPKLTQVCVFSDAFHLYAPSSIVNLLPLVSLSIQPRTTILSTLPFRDSVQIWKFPENNLDVLKFPDKNLEVLTIQKKNLYGA